MINKRKKGTEYEQYAEQFLKDHGCEILEKNYRCHSGEIDLIMKDGVYLVFVEVKYRSSLESGYPSEAIHNKKQKTIYKVAQYYLYKNKIHPDEQPCRFDAILIMNNQIEWLQNAFGGF